MNLGTSKGASWTGPPDGGPVSGESAGAPDLRAQLDVVWRRKWLVLGCLVLIPAAVYFLSSRGPKQYQSSVLVQVQAQTVDTTLFADTTDAPDEFLYQAARLTQTSAVARVAARRVRPRPEDPRALLSQISVTPDLDAGFLTIEARDTDPKRAAAIANAFARAVRTTRADKARAQIDPAIARIERNLAGLELDDVEGRRQLSQQLQRLRALRAAQGNNAQVVEPAVRSSDPVSPRPMRNTSLALILAALLGVGLAFLVEGLDRRIRDVEELERISGLPLLGIVPLGSPDGSARAAELAEAIQILRASITYFDAERKVDVVVVSSPLKGEGKTTVATNLARAVARAGKKVILVDADMRHPQVDVRMGLEPAKRGLGAVLADQCAPTDVLVNVETSNGRLRVFPSGPPPPNPSELLASERMRMLLVELAVNCDVAIIDTPPTLQVADAIPLLRRASGVVVIGRLGATSRQAMRRLVTVIRAAGGSPLGVVATSTEGTGLYGYGAYGGYRGGSSRANGRVPAPRAADTDETPQRT